MHFRHVRVLNGEYTHLKDSNLYSILAYWAEHLISFPQKHCGQAKYALTTEALTGRTEPSVNLVTRYVLKGKKTALPTHAPVSLFYYSKPN